MLYQKSVQIEEHLRISIFSSPEHDKNVEDLLLNQWSEFKIIWQK